MWVRSGPSKQQAAVTEKKHWNCEMAEDREVSKNSISGVHPVTLGAGMDGF